MKSGRLSPPSIILSVAAAGDNKQRNKNEPDIIVFKKIAKTVVHKRSVSAKLGNQYSEQSSSLALIPYYDKLKFVLIHRWVFIFKF